MNDVFYNRFLVFVLLGVIAIIGAGVIIDQANDRESRVRCEKIHSFATCQRIFN